MVVSLLTPGKPALVSTLLALASSIAILSVAPLTAGEPSGGKAPSEAASSEENAEKGVTVDAYKKCWVAMISAKAAAKKENGWWDVWHELKDAEEYFETPHTFSDLKPGKYTIVVYDPASTDYDPNGSNPDQKSDGAVMEEVEVKANAADAYTFDKESFTDWNCLSCPWLYIHNGTDYIRTTEVLKDVTGAKNKTTTRFTLPASAIVNGSVKIRVQEEKQEITHLDRCVLMADGVALSAVSSDTQAAAQVSRMDNDALTLKKGDKVDLEFRLPATVTASTVLTLETSGYYDPEPAFLKEVYSKYLRNSRK